MNILHNVKNKIQLKRPASFALAVLMAGMSFFPYLPITSYAATNSGLEQGKDPVTNPDGTVPNGNKPQDIYDTARVYVNNTPLRLEVSKVKTHVGDHEGINAEISSANKENTITYKFSGRVEGSEARLIQKYGSDNIELAYSSNGKYLGYGWKRGTKEYLQDREEHCDEFGDTSVELIYNSDNIFSGYAYITKKLETADDANRYVAGATMTLYDAIEIFRYPENTEDDRFQGVTVNRNANESVTGVYVNKGYAGTKIEYVKEKTDESKISTDENGVTRNDNYTYMDEINDHDTDESKGTDTWIAKTVQREDTPILYYHLDDLHITSNDTYTTKKSDNDKEIDKIFGAERPDKDSNLYGFDKYGNVIDITQKDQLDFSIYAFEDGNTSPVYEIVGGDLTQVKYNELSKTIKVGEDTIVYHLDKDGNRDAMTDPQTGIAYIEEEIQFGAENSIDFTATKSADSRTVTFKILDNGTGVKNASIGIYDENKKKIDRIRTDENGVATSKELTANSTYYYKIDSIAGYNINEDSKTYQKIYMPEELNHSMKIKVNEDKSSSNIHKNNNKNTKIYVWPVNIYKDDTGSETFEKIKTNRIATINADTDQEYIIGTYDGKSLTKSVNPVLDEHGMIVYYQKSDGTYVKGQDLYDIDGDYIGYAYSDELDNDNLNAYTVKDHKDLYNGDEDNPFDQKTHYQYSTKQSIKVTIDVDGNYIVNGLSTIPTPVRENYSFAGWRVSPTDIANGNVTTVKARWSIGEGQAIPETEKEKWYSSKTATGTTKEMTITFDAAGGRFTDGSGDIHSTDNKLYFRQGESFLIENTWTTGENTPNDPFDTKKVNTIDQTSNTANDPYADTSNGGLADMIKRVAAGNYIMEELNAPAGYVKGLPVGVTVNEMDSVQTTEMVDTTIKIQIIKVDNTDNYTYNVYENGNLKENQDGSKATHKEQTGNFSYKQVKGAVLALKADKSIQKTYNEWIAATKHPNLTKVNDNGNWYVTFKSDSPLYIEGLPKGTYTLSEITTPEGYVTAKDQTIRVDETTELITYIMNDDHTKVEIEKYYNDGNGRKTMPNKYRATLELQDENGNVVESWETDDVSDYTSTVETGNTGFLGKLFRTTTYSGFTYNFESAVTSGEKPNTVEWKVKRTATKVTELDNTETWEVSDGSKVIVKNELPTEDAPEGFKEAYESRNQDAEKNQFTYFVTMKATKISGDELTSQIWQTNTGKQIRTCVYKANNDTNSGKQAYNFEYQFNYKNDYTGKYANTISYDTIDGHHRFDYLPVGTYKIHESKVPDGFVRADDKTIVIKEVGDLQYFDIENIRKELVISKVAMDGKGGFFAGTKDGNVITGSIGKIIKGADLSLYKVPEFNEETAKALKEGNIPENAVLISQWTSGTDGTYTQSDEDKSLIPKGYVVGDLKPHTVANIENGKYYLVENKTPEYYKTIEPIEITVDDNTTASNLTNVSAVNKEMPGIIKVHKVNASGSGLVGATFVVKNKTKGIEVGSLITTETEDGKGYGVLQLSEIGEFDENGNLKPYTFTIQETNPPAGYAVNPEIHEFTFNPNDHDGASITINTNDAAFKDGVLTITDSETTITVGKTDYRDEKPVAGAELQVFEAEYSNNKWNKTNTTKDSWKWTTTAQTNSHALDGLIAGKTYVLTELKAPKGYTKAKDIFFKVSSDGTRIDKIWYDETEHPYISFDTDNTGAVESINVSTRTAIGAYVVLTDEDGKQQKINVSKSGLVLTEENITEGKTYNLKEVIKYSDGSEETVETMTFVGKLNNGSTLIETKYPNEMINTITDHNGNEIASWNPDGNTKTFSNKIVEENQGLFVLKGNGVNHTTINKNANHDTVTYTIKVDKAGSNVTIIPDNQTTITRVDSAFTNENGIYTLTTTEDNSEYKFVALLKDKAVGYVTQRIKIDEKQYSYMNPVAVANDESEALQNSKLVVFNEVEGTNPANDTAEFKYKITITDEYDNALRGRYAYRTKTTDGEYKPESKDNQKTLEVTLSGDDFIVISELPKNAKYSVRMIDPSGDGFSVKNTSADGKTVGNQISDVLFVNTRNLESERELLKKNSTYTVAEGTILNDNSTLESAKYTFSIGENCEVTSFEMKDKATTVKVIKLDMNSKELAGATLAIYDGDTQIKQWNTDEGMIELKAELEPGKTYTLKEIKPAPGYAFANNMKFTVSTDGTLDKVIMVDKYTQVIIKKVDETGKTIAGAKLQILDSEKNPVKAIRTDKNFEAGEDMIFTSSVNGTDITGQLDANTTYYLREIEAPNGYYKVGEDESFTTNRDSEIKVVIMKDDTIKYAVHKKDLTSSEEVAGATISIKDKDGNVIDSWVSGTDGVYTEEDQTNGLIPNGNKVGDLKPHEIIGKLKNGETYTLHEEAAPKGYYYTLDVSFTVSETKPDDDGVVIVKGIVHEIIQDEKTRESFKKTDFTTSNELPGAHIQIKDKDGNIIEEWTSTDKEHVIEGKLEAGKTYIMHEEGAPDGYHYAEDIEFTVPTNKEDQIIHEMKDRPTHIQLIKSDITTGEQVIGAHIEIRDLDGNVLYTWVSDGKAHDLTGILNSDTSYIMHEEGAPNGYHYTADIKFYVPKDYKGIVKVKMEDHATDIWISKKSATTGEEIPGAKLKLTDANGDIIDEWISTSESHKITGKLIAGRKYYLHEEAAPNGYYYAETVEFTVNKDYQGTQKVEMKDDVTKTVISKKDITNGKELPGAHIQIKDEDGNIIEEWTSSDTPHEITGKLEAGKTYIMHEEGAPDGYGYSEDIKFKVPNKNEGIIKVEMKDKPTHAEFKKTDATTSKELPGAHIQVKDEDGNIIEEWTSTDKEHIIEGKLSVDKIYTMHEEGAPDGYTYTDDIKFKVDRNGTTIYVYNESTKEWEKADESTVEMKDKPTHIQFKKTDATTSEELPGAHIQIKDEKGNVIEEWTSTDKDHILDGKLSVDKIYTMHEEGAPDGYGYATDIKFKIDRDGVVYVYNESTKEWEKADESTVEMIDDVLKLEVAKVEKGTNTKLAGAKLQILDSKGNVVEEIITKADETYKVHQKFSNGESIKADEIYTLVEVEAPNGYLKTTSQTFQVNRYGKLTTITMEDSRVDKPWTTPEIEFNTITFDKYNGSYEEETTTISNKGKLAGAEYTIYRNDGTVYTVVATGENGSVTIKRPPAGTYFLKETKAPMGYMIDKNTYSFTVTSTGNVTGTLNVVDYKRPEVVISKKDSETKELIAGATFKILNSNGTVVYTGTTEKNGQLIFTPEYADTYTVIETQAPDGYKLNTTYIKFTVSENGVVSGTTTVYNEKENKKVGRITAYYESKYDKDTKNNTSSNNGIGIDRYGNVILPKSGDTFNVALIAFAWIASLGTIIYLFFKKRRSKK